MTYHFQCLKNSVVLHMNDVSNGSVWITVRKPHQERLVRVSIHLNQNSLHSREGRPHVLH